MQQETADGVVNRINRFRSNVNISLRSASPILGVSHTTLIRWIEGMTEPYDWMAEAVSRRLDIFDREHDRSGLYTKMAALDTKERVEVLHQVLHDHTEQ